MRLIDLLNNIKGTEYVNVFTLTKDIVYYQVYQLKSRCKDLLECLVGQIWVDNEIGVLSVYVKENE